MQRPDALWSRICRMSLRGAPLPSWQREFGEAFGQVRGLLLETGRRAEYVRCPRCACSHEVVEDGDRLIGVCRCEEHRGCPDMVFEDEEVLRIWGLNRIGLFLWFCRTFALKWAELEEQAEGLIGWHGSGNTIPFFWVPLTKDAELARYLERMKGVTYSGAVMLLPSLSAFGPVSRALVGGKGIVAVECEEVFEIGECGELKALRSVEELVAPVLAWRGEEAGGLRVVREGMEALQKGMGQVLRNTDKIPGLVGEIDKTCVQPLKAHLDRRLDAVGEDFASLKEENEKLKGDLAAILSHIAQKVDPEFFKWLFVILATGTITAAARALKLPRQSFKDSIDAYIAKGGLYKTLYDMVDIRRRGLGVKSMESFNDLWEGHQNPQDLNQVDLLKDLLNGLEEMNVKNWYGIRDELIEHLREAIP